jgi:hypothetical protein
MVSCVVEMTRDIVPHRGLTSAGVEEAPLVGEIGAGTSGVEAALSFESLPTATPIPIPIPTPIMRSIIKQHMTIAKHVITFHSCEASIDDHRMDHILLLSSDHGSPCWTNIVSTFLITWHS